MWIQFTIVFVTIRSRSAIHILKSALPCSVSAQSTFIVDAPGEDLVIGSKSNSVHTATGKLNNVMLGDFIGVESRVELGHKCSRALRAETKFTALPTTK